MGCFIMERRGFEKVRLTWNLQGPAVSSVMWEGSNSFVHPPLPSSVFLRVCENEAFAPCMPKPLPFAGGGCLVPRVGRDCVLSLSLFLSVWGFWGRGSPGCFPSRCQHPPGCSWS